MKTLILMLMVILFTPVWGNDEPDINKNDNFQIDDSSNTNKVLTIEQCQTSEHHVTIDGRYVDVENKCLRHPEPVGCMEADIGCGDALTIAQAPNSKCYWFSSTCIPNGWQVVGSDDEPSCRQSYMNWNECPSLKATTFQGISLTWNIGKPNSVGFRIWRVVEDGKGGYKKISTLEEINSYQGKGNCIEGKLIASGTKEPSPLISKVLNHLNEEACYSFIEIGVAKNQTYYYVLEEVDIKGNSIFHCDDIVAVTVAQGLPINLETVKNYCRQVTGGGG